MESAMNKYRSATLAGSQVLGYVEILNRLGRVVQRLPLQQNELSIGRDFKNDLVLDDPFACPQHALLKCEDGLLKVTDLDSVNGISQGKQGRAQELSINPNESFRVGHTLLRYRSGTDPLPPTLIDRYTHSPLRLFEHPAMQATLIMLAVGFFLLSQYLKSTREFELLKAVPTLVGALAVVIVWSMIWAFASRTVSQRWRFWTQCAITCAGWILYQVSATLISYFCFIFALDGTLTILSTLFEVALVGMIIFLQLSFVTVVTRRRLVVAATVVSFGLLLFTEVLWYSNRDDFSASPEYEVTLKAPVFKMASSVSVDEFFAEADSLYEKAVELAEEEEQGK